MMAPKLRFSRGLKAKAPGACHCLSSRPAPTPLVEIFTGPSTTTGTRSNDGEGDDFFFTFEGLSSVWLLFYNVLTQRSCLGFLLLAMFHSQWCSYIRTDDPSTKAMARPRRAFTVSWNVEVFVHSRSVVIFPPGAHVTSFLSQQISTVIRRPRFQQDETSSLLGHCRNESHQTYSSYQLVASGNIHTATTLFPFIWTKTARSIEELFPQWKRPRRASSDQRTDEEDTSETCNNNNHVGGRALTNAKKQNWGGTYIRPWPPGWSFSRHIYIYIYMSRGSERVKIGHKSISNEAHK